MKIIELCEKIKSGEVEVDLQGHTVSMSKEEIIERYNSIVADANGANDGKWSIKEGESIEEVNKTMRDFNFSILNSKIREDGYISSFIFRGSPKTCYKCGRSYGFFYRDNKIIYGSYHFQTGDSWKDFETRFDNERCSFEVIKPQEVTIDVDEDLVFCNYFSESDCPEGEEHSDEYSLNIVAGRYEICKYKANKNVAYAQTGNTTIGIYLSKDKKSIIYGPSYKPDPENSHKMTDEEYEEYMNIPLFDGYDLVDSVMCECWRIEASSRKDLDTSGDVVTISVPLGKWKFTNYYEVYRHSTNDWNGPFAKFELNE